MNLTQKEILILVSGIIGGGILSLIIGWFFYRKSKNKKELSYCSRSSVVLNEALQKESKVTVLYDGLEIDSLSISRFVVWNSGNDTIEVTNFSKKSPPKLIFNRDELLEVNIIYKNANDIKINIDFDKIDSDLVNLYYDIEFEYLDKNQGFVLEVKHLNKSLTNFKIEGVLKKYGNPRLKELPEALTEPPRKFFWFNFRWLDFLFKLIVGLISVYIGIMISKGILGESSTNMIINIIGAVILGGMFGLGGILIIRDAIQLYFFSAKIPDDLHKAFVD